MCAAKVDAETVESRASAFLIRIPALGHQLEDDEGGTRGGPRKVSERSHQRTNLLTKQFTERK